MFPFEKKVKKKDSGYNPARELAREEFFNITDRKIFDTNVKRENLKHRLLFDINLEERRGKLRNLLENEENLLTEEHLSKVETLETRSKNLKDEALRIRKQTELERQEIAKVKREKSFLLNDDGVRGMQGKFCEQNTIQDWEKLKEIKKRLNREEYCTEKFWHLKNEENIERLIEKENLIKDRKNEMKQDSLEHLALREEERKILKEKEIENHKRELELAKEVDRLIAEEKLEEHSNKIDKQKRYRDILDKHIKYKKSLQDKHKILEECFDEALSDENLQKLKNRKAQSKLVEEDNFKSNKNFMHYMDCFKKQKIEDEKILEDKVNKIQHEVHANRFNIEKEKSKKYKELIVGIKKDQKNQLLEKEKIKERLKKEKIEEREFANKVYQESIEKDALKLQKEKEMKRVHFNYCSQQRQFNDELQKIRKAEHERERNSMIEAENQYINTIKDLRSKEKLNFEHPWRVI